MKRRYSSPTFPYHLDFSKIDFRKQPALYRVGRGEQGVLLVEPYKSEILPYWRFKTPEIAEVSAKKLFKLFEAYKRADDFVGMDMTRKFLQMGYTRARRYANHPTGKKYDDDGLVLPLAEDRTTSEKAVAARIFYEYYVKAREDGEYKKKRKVWDKEKNG